MISRAALAAAFSVALTASASAQLLPVAHPDTSGLEPEVATQLAAVRQRLAAAQRTSDGGAGTELAAAFGDCGRTYLVYDLLAPAEACLRNAASLNPGDPRWPYYLGEVAMRRRDPVEARRWLGAVLSLRPTQTLAALRVAELDLQAGDLAAAARGFERAAGDADLRAAALHGLARVALERGEPARAIALLEEALRLQPGAGGLHYVLGMAYRRAGDSSRARQHLARAGEAGGVAYRDPWMDELTALDRSSRGHFARGTQLLGAGKVAEAKRELQSAVEVAPEDAQAWLNLGVALERGGEAAAAEAAYRRAAALAPQLARPAYNLGALLLRQGSDEGLRWMEVAVRLDPASPNARYNLAVALLAQGRAEAALEHLDWLRSNQPGDPQAAYQRGLALLALDRPDEAVTELSAIAAAAPAVPEVRLAEARALLAAGREPAARERLEEALTRLPGNEELKRLLDSIAAGSQDATRRPLQPARWGGPEETLSGGPWFEERARELGIDFVHESVVAGRYLMPEVMGPGLALFDADGDDDLDLFLVQGGDLERPAISPGGGHRLLRNQLAETGSPGFTDVTDASGVTGCAFGMGVTTGDYDNDGRNDLYVTCLGSNQLWHNEGVDAVGRPRFRDATRQAGADDDRWSVSAAFLDFDRDGWLDLYVGNYLRFSTATHPACRTRSGEPDWCGPVAADAVPGRLLHNRGDGKFEDVTQRSGLAAEFGPGLGVAVFDFDGDGWIDVYVANDRTPNQLWLNARDGTFRNDALAGGCALSGEGNALASMGIDAGDYDGDGDLDVVTTNFIGEGIALHRNAGGLCEDASVASGLRGPSVPFNGFGTAWTDFDNDGWLDVLAVNGAVAVIDEQVRAGDPLPLRQRKQLFRNLGDGRFAEAAELGGPALAVPEVSRGAAFGDVDGDGDTDVAIANTDGPARLLLNRVGDRQPWLGVRLLTAQGREALGAVLTLEREGAAPLVRPYRAAGSYASASDPRVIFGLGQAASVRRLVVRWPSGRLEAFVGLQAGRYTTLREGSGAPP